MKAYARKGYALLGLGRCRAAAACAFEAPVARTRRNATDLVALLALPLDEDLEPALVRRSVCAARRAFGGVVVGVCDGAASAPAPPSS